jgi:hypothetical protein
MEGGQLELHQKYYLPQFLSYENSVLGIYSSSQKKRFGKDN